jgi:hypothetical protein
MNTPRTIAAAAGLAIIALTIPSVTSAAAGGHDSRQETLTFHDLTIGTAVVDINHDSNPDPGDNFIFHEQDRRNATIVEYNDSTCTVALADEYICHVIVTVADRGEIVLDASINAPGGQFPTDIDLAITGGTGDFTHARGYGHAHHISDTVSNDTLYITP